MRSPALLTVFRFSHPKAHDILFQAFKYFPRVEDIKTLATATGAARRAASAGGVGLPTVEAARAGPEAMPASVMSAEHRE